MALAFLLALALYGAEPPATPADPPVTSASSGAESAAPAASTDQADPAEKAMTRDEIEDVIPEGAPKEDYEFVAWCHGALAGQIELDPLVEKDMDAIEGKAKAAKRRADDVEIAKEHKKYMALYEKALSAAEKASPNAIHEKGVQAELQGYRIWGPTRNKAPVWRMVDWGNWEVPPHCEKAAQRLYDRASLFGAALKTEDQPAPVSDLAQADKAAPAPDAAAPDAKVKDVNAAPTVKPAPAKRPRKGAAKPIGAAPAATPYGSATTPPTTAPDAPPPAADPNAAPKTDAPAAGDALRGPQ